MFAVGFIGYVLPYVTIITFVSAVVYRIHGWNKAKAGKMTLFPAPATPQAKWRQIMKEVLVFRRLFEGNKPLWAGAWIFHAALALILLGHCRVVADFPLLWKALHLDNAEVNGISAAIGGTAGVVLLAMGCYLLYRRFAVDRVREISDVEDYIGLILILAIIATGDILRFGTQFDLGEARKYFSGIFTFRAVPIPSNPFFLLHFFLGQILIIYIPFSKFMHIPGVFYSKSLLYGK